MRCRILACLFLAAAAGCDAHSNSLVVVDLSANAPLAGVTALDCWAKAGQRMVTFTIRPPSGSLTLDPGTQSFGIDLPTSYSGAIHVHVDAIGSAGTLASGDADGTIKPQQRLELPLQLIVTGVMPPPDDMAQSGIDQTMPTGPALAINNAMQNFGDVTQNGMSAPLDITISNVGDMPSSDLAFSTAGANLDQFSIVNKSCTGILQPGAKCAVTVQFLPKALGPMTASFTVQAVSGGSVTATLSGNSTAPGKLSIAPASGDCGSSLIGTKSTKTASFTVTNMGNSDTGVTSATTGDAANPSTQQFFATGCGGMLGAGQSCTVTVSFTPNARGPQTTSVSVSANPGGQANATVSGAGLAAATFSIAPAAGSSAAFPSQARSSTSGAMTYVATNQGDVQSPLLSNPVTSDATTFPIVGNTCNNNAIAPGASCNIQVAFAPQTSTTLSTTLSVLATVNGTPTPLGKLTLSGTGTPVWQQENPPATITMPSAIYSVSGTGPGLVLFGGPTGAILQRTASGSVTWTNVSLNFPSPPDVNLLWTTTNPSTHAAQEYLLGNNSLMSTNAPPNWANVSGAPAPVTGLYGFSTSDLWTSYTTGTTSAQTSSLYHWNGTAWATETSTQGGAISLWGTSDTDLFAYGSDVEGSVRKSIVMHRGANATWTLQGAGQLPMLGITANGVTGVNGMWGFGSPANDVYAITSGSGLYHSTGDGNWAQVTNAPAGTQGPHTSCYAVFGAVASAVWVACPGGVYVYDGVNKVWGTNGLVASGVTFNALWGSGPNDVYAVGQTSSAGVIYHYY